jgi:PleD family two-component response regulator
MQAVFGIDIAIIDVTGGIPCYRMIERMRQSYIYQDVPVIAMSEHSRAEGMSSSFAYGASDFFSKPIEEYELKARVRAGIRLKYEIERRKARERELIEAINQLSDLNEVLSNQD